MRFEMAQTEIEKLRLLTGKKLPDEMIADQARWCFEEGFDRRTVMVNLSNEFTGTARYSFSYKEIMRSAGVIGIRNFELIADGVWKDGRIESVNVTLPDYSEKNVMA